MVKTESFCRKIPPLALLAITLALPLQNNAQLVKRQCISCYSASALITGIRYEMTVGQPFSTFVSGDSPGSFFPGFQQPALLGMDNLRPAESKALQLTIYPNPAAYSAMILSPEPADNMIIIVTDSNGKPVMSDNKASLQSYTINCSNWEDGIYLITVHDRKQLRNSMKLIIKK